MSYRSFKRVLGETSLERKCRFLFGGCLLVLITGSFWWYGTETEKLVDKQNRTKGQALVETIMVRHHWEKLSAQELGKQAPDELRGLDYTDLNVILGEDLQAQGYRHAFLLPERGPDDPPIDDFERDLLPRMQPKDKDDEEAPPPLEFAERRLAEHGQYVYYQAVRARHESCVSCHRIIAGGDQAPGGMPIENNESTAGKLQLGDLMAVVRVDIDDAETRRDINRNRAILLSTAIVTVFLAMLAAYVIVRYVIAKPLKHLRDVSDGISNDELDRRVEIHTGDEFEELGVAFNRMVRKLIDAQQELRELNSDLDGKVDELAKVNLKLFEMNRLKSDFLATMSHELRTPLNSILGFSDVLGSINALDDRQKRYVQNIQKSGKMLLDMINDILDLAKIESGKIDVRVSAFGIEQVVAAQCDLARPLAERKNLDVDVEIEDDLPPLHQDQNKVQQILNNLLSNAIKFTPDGGRVSIQARRDEHDQLVLVVADTGVGISADDQQTIFEKFRQGSTVAPGGDAMTREYSGTGLGLSIVKELCRLLGGTVSVESELGRGSVFTVRLPWTLADASRLDAARIEGLDELTTLRRADYEALLERTGAARRAEAATPR